MATDNQERADLARYLLQHSADDAPPIQLTGRETPQELACKLIDEPDYNRLHVIVNDYLRLPVEEMPFSEIVEAIGDALAKNARLEAALARLQGLKNNNYIAPLENEFVVSIRDADYEAMTVAYGYGATLLEACEAALTAYDALPENER
jgi:hypothetical protein